MMPVFQEYVFGGKKKDQNMKIFDLPDGSYIFLSVFSLLLTPICEIDELHSALNASPLHVRIHLVFLFFLIYFFLYPYICFRNFTL